jgi:hypothetical protein
MFVFGSVFFVATLLNLCFDLKLPSSFYIF